MPLLSATFLAKEFLAKSRDEGRDVVRCDRGLR